MLTEVDMVRNEYHMVGNDDDDDDDDDGVLSVMDLQLIDRYRIFLRYLSVVTDTG